MIKKPVPKTQKEISKSLPDPYLPERGNPNPIVEDAQIKSARPVGPFARTRPGTILEDKAKYLMKKT